VREFVSWFSHLHRLIKERDLRCRILLDPQNLLESVDLATRKNGEGQSASASSFRSFVGERVE